MFDKVAAFADWLGREDHFTLIAHLSPDGDTLGSNLALYAILRAMNKTVQVVCEDAMPYLYAFLPNADKVVGMEHANQTYTNAISIDCADEDRMGVAKELFVQAATQGNIDHHLTNLGFGTFVLHSVEAAASAELVYLLWVQLQVAQKGPAAQDIATCLYTGISTDTGNFSYSNTTPETFRIAAKLLEYGIDISTINRLLYRTVPIGKAKLLGHVLNTLRLYENGKIGIATVFIKDMERTKAALDDIEGMIDHVRDIDTVELAILLRESNDGSYKVSLRSKQHVDVSKFAEEFGGGGHLRAAGCTLYGEWTQVYHDLLKAAQEALSQS